jgi:hypothetical protein
MDFTQQQQIGDMLRGAILNQNDGESLNGIRAVRKKLVSFGVDPHNISIFDASAGAATRSAAAAISEKYRLVAEANEREKTIDRCISILQSLDSDTVILAASNRNNPVGYGRTSEFIKELVMGAGPDGMTRDEIRGAAPDNTQISKRIADVVKLGSLFELADKRLVHKNFKNHHKAAFAKSEAARQNRVS